MEIQITKGDILESKAELLVIGSYQGESMDNNFLTRLDDLLNGKLHKYAKTQEFEGKAGQTLLFPAADAMKAEYALVVGLGELGDLSEENIEGVREAAGAVLQIAKKLGLSTISMELFGEDDEKFDAFLHGQALGEALLLADYEFTTYKKTKSKVKINNIEIVAENGQDARKAQRGVEKAIKVVKGVILARDLVNTPAQDMCPEKLSSVAREIAKESKGKVKVRILDKEQCLKKTMGAFLAVAQGSDSQPQFIHLSYKPVKAKKSIALVGKGITFDSGGLSLKPARSMETMKCDMAGAASVLGVFSILTSLEPNIEVHGIIAATENLLSSKAMKPGDIVEASNKKTIEILNTDAEGRLALADSLVYASKLKPDAIIDLATLTGACVVALGEEISAIMSNNAELANKLIRYSSESGEKMWEMPLEKKYRKLIESDVADLRNISTTNYGGTLTATLFLQEFVPKEIPWAHLDIAGPAFAERPMASYIQKGGTGFGVRTLIRFIEGK